MNPTSPVAEPNKKPETNIFTSPLKKKGAEARHELKKRNQRRGFIYLAIAALFLSVYSYYFLYDQLHDYLGFEQEVRTIENQIENYEVTLSDLQNTRDFHKVAYDEEFKEEQEIINMIFPETTDKLGIIRLMENFATHLAASYPPFEFNSISFQETVKENGYTVLPFQTSIHSSRSNFERFLGLVNLSGNLDSENPDHIRLMEISNISLRYRGVDKAGKDLGVDFTVKLNAYSR